jgi:arsenate reductase (thioredoxin)
MQALKVLFVSVKNSARSQIAEAFLSAFGNETFHAESAGLESGQINKLAVDVMREMDIDIANNTTKSIFDLYQQGKLFNYIILLCDEESLRKCPMFSFNAKRFIWSFEDPAYFTGTYEEKLEKMREVRNQIRENIEKFVHEVVLTEN